MHKLMLMGLSLAASLGRAGPFAMADTGNLDLAELLSRADASNPEIQARQARAEALKHVPSQVGTYPDPIASVSYTNETLTAFTLGSLDMSNLTFSWLQEVPYPGKRRLAGDVARAEIDVAGQTVEVQRVRVRAAVKVAYAELYRIDRTFAILQESRKLLESFREAARVRQETGRGLLENVLKAQTELIQVDVELAGLAQERRSVLAALNAVLGSAESVLQGRAVVPPIVESPEAAIAEQAATDRSPELNELRAAIHRDESRVNLAKKNLKPDFMWGAGYANRGSLEPMVMGMFGIRLPLYKNSKQKEAVVQSEFDLKGTERDLDSRAVTLLAEVRDLLARADRASDQMRLIEEGTLPLARSTLDSAAASYSAGRSEFVTLIEDFRALLGYEINLEVQRAEKVKALAALETITRTEYVFPDDKSHAPGVEHD